MTDLTNWRGVSFDRAPVLTGHYARLERLQADRHAAELYRANKEDPSIWDHLPYGPFDTVEAYADWVKDTECWGHTQFYAIHDLAQERYCGVISYLRDDPAMGVLETGHLNFAAPLQRTPAATEAVYLMIDQAMRAGYRRFEWKCDAKNIPSRRAAQRFGFSYEGVFRQHQVVKGRNRDTAWFAIMDHEWPSLRQAFETWLSPENFDSKGTQKQSLATLTGPHRVASDPAF